jgi:hypothetical protein
MAWIHGFRLDEDAKGNSNYNPTIEKFTISCFVLSGLLLVAQLNLQPTHLMMLIILDMIMDVMMQEYSTQIIDTSINQKKSQLFILAGLWMDTMTALPVMEQMIVRLYQHRQAPVKVKASQAQARARADFLQNVAIY